MLGGNKKITHAESCRFVEVCVTFLLPPAIKGLKSNEKIDHKIFAL